MKKITVFYDNTSYTLTWLRALVWAKIFFRELDYDIEFDQFDAFIPYMSRKLHRPSTKDDFIGLFNKQYDIVFLAYHHSNAGLSSIQSEDRIEVLQHLRKRSNKIIWLDTADGTGTCFFDVLPYIDLYLKKQVLIDLNLYKKEIWSNRIFGEYYHNTLGIQETGQKENIKYYSVLEPQFIDKLGISWNVGLGDLFANGTTKYFYRKKYSPANFSSPSMGKKIDIYYRGSAYPGAIGYQRMHSRELLQNRSDISIVDVNTKVSYKEYVKESMNSKALLSPFGFGEICGRDFEAFIFGAALIKPDMSHLRTYPNIYKENETYISIDWDFGNFNEIIDMFKTEAGKKQVFEIATNGQKIYKEYLLSKEKKAEFAYHIVSQLERV